MSIFDDFNTASAFRGVAGLPELQRLNRMGLLLSPLPGSQAPTASPGRYDFLRTIMNRPRDVPILGPKTPEDIDIENIPLDFTPVNAEPVAGKGIGNLLYEATIDQLPALGDLSPGKLVENIKNIPQAWSDFDLRNTLDQAFGQKRGSLNTARALLALGPFPFGGLVPGAMQKVLEYQQARNFASGSPVGSIDGATVTMTPGMGLTYAQGLNPGMNPEWDWAVQTALQEQQQQQQQEFLAQVEAEEQSVIGRAGDDTLTGGERDAAIAGAMDEGYDPDTADNLDDVAGWGDPGDDDGQYSD